VDTINLEASPRLRWRSEWFFLVLALLGGVALTTAEFVDPTIFSPLTPPEGIHNWLGLPGALIGGSLLEVFGPPAPLLFWFLIPLSRPHWHRFSLLSGWYHSLLLCWLLSILHVLVLTMEHNTVPFQGLWSYGYLGFLGSQWILQHLPHLEAAAVIGAVCFYLSVRIYTALPFLPILRGLALLIVSVVGLAQALPWQALLRGMYRTWEQLKLNLRIMVLMPETASVKRSSTSTMHEVEGGFLLTENLSMLDQLERKDPNNLNEAAMLYEQWLQYQEEEEVIEIPVLTTIPKPLPNPVGLSVGPTTFLKKPQPFP
jgi:hypothetical protein